MDRQSISIMIVEDNLILLETMTDILEFQNYHCVPCDTIQKAKESYENRIPDLIICDLNLPDAYGIDFLKSLRNGDAHSPVPFICVTGDHERQTFRKCMTSGAQDFLTKPFTPDELIESVESLLKRTVLRVQLKNQIQNKINEVNHINSHELRHSLTKLTGLLEMMKEDELSIEDCTEFFDEISNEFESGIAKVNEIIHEKEQS